MMPPDGLEQRRSNDAIFLGGGLSRCTGPRLVVGLLVPIRRGVDQYVNLRPVGQSARRSLAAGGADPPQRLRDQGYIRVGFATEAPDGSAESDGH